MKVPRPGSEGRREKQIGTSGQKCLPESSWMGVELRKAQAWVGNSGALSLEMVFESLSVDGLPQGESRQRDENPWGVVGHQHVLECPQVIPAP